MAESRKGTLINAGTVADLAVTGPAAMEDGTVLDRTSLATLLAWVVCRRATGQMRVAVSARETLVVECGDGAILSIEREAQAFTDEVVAQMVEKEILTHAVAAKAAAEAGATKRPLIQVLLGQGVCTPRAIVESIRHVKNGHLGTLAAAPQAAYEWTEGGGPRTRTDPVTIDLTIFLVNLVRERSRSAYYADIEPLLKPWFGRYPVRTVRLTPLVAGTALNDKERKVMDNLVDGSNTLREVFSLAMLSTNQTARLFLACNFLGLVEYRTTPIPKGGVEDFEKQLKNDFDRVQGEDHFTRLAVHWTSHPRHIEPAFRKRQQQWGPEAPARKFTPRCAELVDGIMRFMQEAFDVLSAPERRRAYRLEIIGQSQIEFGTEFLLKQAHLAKFRGELDKATEIIESAIDVVPKPHFLAFRNEVGGGRRA
jgi:hypothetical protein